MAHATQLSWSPLCRRRWVSRSRGGQPGQRRKAPPAVCSGLCQWRGVVTGPADGRPSERYAVPLTHQGMYNTVCYT
eukprot:scaffold3_cov389-Prasinococcus_capsulatus_cf.AAC.7